MVIAFFSCNNSKEDIPNTPTNPSQVGQFGGADKGSLLEALEGNYLFSVRSIKYGEENEPLGYLHLKDDKFKYTSKNKSPYKYAFVVQEKGSYNLQYLSKFHDKSPLSKIDITEALAKIEFEIVGADDSVIKEFFIHYDKEKGKMIFHSLMGEFQLWNIEKPL